LKLKRDAIANRKVQGKKAPVIVSQKRKGKMAKKPCERNGKVPKRAGANRREKKKGKTKRQSIERASKPKGKGEYLTRDFKKKKKLLEKGNPRSEKVNKD